MGKDRQISSKTHDPFVVLPYFGGSLGLHCASLFIMCMRRWYSEKEPDPAVKWPMTVLMWANITAIIGIIGKAALKGRFAEAQKKQDDCIASLGATWDETEYYLNEHKKEEEEKEKEKPDVIQEGGEKEEKDEAATTDPNPDAKKEEEEPTRAEEVQRLDLVLEEQQRDGSLKDFSSSYIMLNSVFGIVPTFLFFFAIFQLIVYLLIIEYEPKKIGEEVAKTSDGKEIYHAKANPSLTYSSQTTHQVTKLYNFTGSTQKIVDNKTMYEGTLATAAGEEMDDYLPVFIIVLVDWLINFSSMVIFLICSFLYKFSYSENDQIEERQSAVQMVAFIFNMTLQNIIIIGVIHSYGQMVLYDFQYFEFKVDLLIAASFTILMVLIFFMYIKHNVVYNLDDLDDLFEKNPFIAFIWILLCCLILFKLAICLLGHPFIIARNFFVPYDDAFAVSYVWVQFYFIEVLLFIPNATILALNIKSEMEANKVTKIRATASLVDEELTPTEQHIVDEKYMEKTFLVPLYYKLNAEEGKVFKEMSQQIKNVYLDAHDEDEEDLLKDPDIDVNKIHDRQDKPERVTLKYSLILPFDFEIFEKDHMADHDDNVKQKITKLAKKEQEEKDEEFSDWHCYEDDTFYDDLYSNYVNKFIETVKSHDDSQPYHVQSLQMQIDNLYPKFPKVKQRFPWPLNFTVAQSEEGEDGDQEDGNKSSSKVVISLQQTKLDETRKFLGKEIAKFVQDRDNEIVELLEETIELLNPEFETTCLNGTELTIEQDFDNIPSILSLGKELCCEVCGKTLKQMKEDMIIGYSAEKNSRQIFCQSCTYNTKSERFLELSESVYDACFVTMLTDKGLNPPQPMTKLTKISSLFNTTQMVFVLQVVIFMLLVSSNWNKDAFQKPTASFMLMRMVTAFMFHITVLGDARGAYQKLKFLIRYPQRFEHKLRLSLFIICLEQFTITLLVEFVNLVFLCKQESYEDLILNYVAFAGILAIDDDFMGIQARNHKKAAEWIEKADEHIEFKLYKDPKFHDRFNLSPFIYRVTFGIFKFLYKVVYFYITPLFIVWVSFIGFDYWQREALDAKQIAVHERQLIDIDKEFVQKEYYDKIEAKTEGMRSQLYMVYVWLILSLVFAIIKVQVKQGTQSILFRVISIVLNIVYFVLIQFICWEYFWPIWSGEAEFIMQTDWLKTFYDMPLGIGYLHMTILLGLWINGVENVTLYPAYAGDTFPGFLKHTAMTVGQKFVGALKVLVVSVLSLLIAAPLEWLLDVCYILKGFYFVFLIVLGIPLYVVMYSFTHAWAFLCLVGFIMLLYCGKQLCCPKGAKYKKKKDNEQPLIADNAEEPKKEEEAKPDGE